MLCTGMILDLVDNVANCRHLNCPLFPIDFQCTSKHVPVTDKPDATVNQAKQFNNLIRNIESLERYYDTKVQASGSQTMHQNQAVHFGSKSAAHAAVSESGSVVHAMHPSGGISPRWVQPTSVYEDDDYYHSSVLGEDSYL